MGDESSTEVRDAKDIAEFLISGHPFQLYKARLRRFVYGLPSAVEMFKIAIRTQDVDTAAALLKTDWILIAQDEEFEWLDELFDLGYSSREIAEAVIEGKGDSSWISFIQPTLDIFPDLEHHQPSCAHHWSLVETKNERDAENTSPFEDTVDVFPNRETVQQIVAETCGLAGVIPAPGMSSDWNSKVQFISSDFSAAKVSYASAESVNDIHSIVRTMSKISKGLLGLCGWLQRNQLCCNNFTVLVRLPQVHEVELICIPFTIVVQLHSILLTLATPSDDTDRQERALMNLSLASTHALNLLGLELHLDYLGKVLHGKSFWSIHWQTAVNSCAIAFQMLCLGMLAHNQAHVGPLKPFFLKHDLEEVDLLGIDGVQSDKLSLQLMDLSCMGEALGGSVLVFTVYGFKPLPGTKHNLLASPEDLLDAFGPGHFILDRSIKEGENLCAIEIGEGTIKRCDDQSNMLHWSKGSFDFERSTSPCFAVSRKVPIGGRAVQNQACPNGHALDDIDSACMLKPLGTSKGHWELQEKEVGIQGGYYFVAVGNLNYVKVPGVTRKHLMCYHSPSQLPIPFLDGPWGVQVSLCTSVVQRVPLRELIADAIVPMMEAEPPLPEEWYALLHTHNMLDNLRSNGFPAWAKALPATLQTALAGAVHRILNYLRDTGFDKHTDELVFACPVPENPRQCLRIPCKNHVWAKVLQDTEDCATFACVTTKCLETCERKCRGNSCSPWSGESALLATAVSQFELRKNDWHVDLSQLRDGMNYWIGDPSAKLIAMWLTPDPVGAAAAETRLQILPSRVPLSVRKVFEAKKTRRLQERQTVVEVSATEVLLLNRVKVSKKE